jgi:ABC transport system ATP-binding/permease protein
MSLILNCRSLRKSFGSRTLFENVSLTISDGDRLGLIGPNGSGKSTLLKILAGTETSDSGDRSLRKGATLSYVPQDSVFPAGATVLDVLTAACKRDEEFDAKLNTIIGVAGFTEAGVSPLSEAASLSGGWRKRLAIAEALIQKPDILLLDEPTNHLDVAGIIWLERLLASARFACVLVSHDRYFLENVTTSMAELNRLYPDGLFRAAGPYSAFLEKRADFASAQSKLEDSLQTKVRREIEWLRRGAKARTTKSKARIDEANRLIGDLAGVSDRRRSGVARIDFSASDRQTKRLLEATGVACEMGGRTLFSGLDLRISPGVRIGLLGGNGTGKTSLLRLFLNELSPSAGEIFRADNLRMVYFDQNRDQLDLDVPLRRALAPHGDSVIYQGRVQHVAGWAKRFLFREDQLDVMTRNLSGGERARVLIARLMLREGDILLLDEPTNDLDIATLEVLEESLLDFPGGMILVTHDRFLLDRVSTSILAFEPNGTLTLYADYAQWEQAQRLPQKNTAPGSASKESKNRIADVALPARKKLSYMEAREWDQMEARILTAETALAEHQNRLQAPDVVTDALLLQKTYAEMQAAQIEVEELYARWAELGTKLD